MDKLTAIKIKYDDGTYSNEIPVGVLSENVEWDSTHTLVDVLGSIDVSATGTIQDQISQLFNEKVSNSDMQAYITNSVPTYITNWLNTNVNPVGSAVVVDSSLTVSGAAADAKVTGEKLAILKGEFDEISEATNNLFNPYSLTIGMNGTGATGIPVRALSEPIYVGTNGCCVKAYNLPENLKYGIEFYNTAETSSRVDGTPWQTTTGVYNYIRSEPYIRILFASVDNSSLTREDFVDLELMINLGSNILPYEQHLTATDDVARASIDSINVLSNFPANVVDGWIGISGDVEPHKNIFCQSVTQIASNDVIVKASGEYYFFVTTYDNNVVTRGKWVQLAHIRKGSKYRLTIRYKSGENTNINYCIRNVTITTDTGNAVISSRNAVRKSSPYNPFKSDLTFWYNRNNNRVDCAERLPIKNRCYYTINSDDNLTLSVYLYKNIEDTDYLYYPFNTDIFYVPKEYNYVVYSCAKIDTAQPLLPTDVAQSNLNVSMLYDESENINGIVSLNPNLWRVGSLVNGEPAPANNRLTTIDFIELSDNVCLYVDTNVKVRIECYHIDDSGYRYIGNSGYTPITFQLPYNTNAIKIIVSINDAIVTLSDLSKVHLVVREIKEQIRVATFNCGLYYDGVTRTPNDIIHEQLAKWLHAIGEMNPDLLLAQEATEFMDVNKLFDSDAYLWNNLLNYKYTNQTNKILSRVNYFNQKYENWSGDKVRGINSADIVLHGVPVHVMSVHLSIEPDASVNRVNEINKIIEEMDKYPIVICGGDFNAFSEDEFAPLKAKYTVLNTGKFGSFKTWKGSTTWPYRCLDNIIVKGLSPSFVESKQYGLSDHEPLFAILNFRTVKKS